MMLIDELREIIIRIIYTPLLYVQIPLCINKKILDSKLQKELVEQNVCAICRRMDEWVELVNIYVIMTYWITVIIIYYIWRMRFRVALGHISVIWRVDIMYVATLYSQRQWYLVLINESHQKTCKLVAHYTSALNNQKK